MKRLKSPQFPFGPTNWVQSTEYWVQYIVLVLKGKRTFHYFNALYYYNISSYQRKITEFLSSYYKAPMYSAVLLKYSVKGMEAEKKRLCAFW